LGNRYFLCRRCHDLAYESQREDYATRMISRPQKVRRRLGGSASLMEPFPPKLRYMRWHVYSQLYLKAQRAEEAGMQAALAQLQRMYSRSGMGKHGHDRLCWVSHPLTEHRLA
jgi:hypothetical protein